MTQQPAGGAQPGTLNVNVQGNWFTQMITPQVFLDGQLLPVKRGPNRFPVHPGQHLVAAKAQWMWEYGQAQQQVTVNPGAETEVWYAAPLLTFMKGAMGPTKQKMPGGLAFGLLMGLLLVMFLLMILLPIIVG